MSVPLAAIFGCSGLELGDEERQFFAAANPLGFILFQRNCDSPDQVRDLVFDLRLTVGRVDAPVLIDQEGGRVARLKPPHWREAPPAARFAALAARDPDAAVEATEINARLIAAELLDLGITVDCAPVLDLPQPGADPIIGDRAFGADPVTVATLGGAACRGLIAGGVLPVIKHIPGHGRASVDSHKALPVVDTPWAELASRDFAPFAALNAMPWAMTAHVVYTDVDPDAPATTSAKVIEKVIRKHMGFEGALMSDDLSMKALAGDMGDRTRAALDAGCDVVLHCNGDMAEMTAVAKAATVLDCRAEERVKRAAALRQKPGPFDRAAALARLETLLEAVPA